jgi:hypothetical protein
MCLLWKDESDARKRWITSRCTTVVLLQKVTYSVSRRFSFKY